ncbi:MAG TPA: hypothetical protein VGR03_17105 [Candidatus Acidoferrum sp.]|nr:hypothetical protein [Candidatus Acidoferrum sp.]HVS74143.1 hypothetical protein [Candidatus Acidoferrales bacterium]
MNVSFTQITNAVLFVAGSLVPTFASAQAYSGPKCVGPVCIDRKLPFERLAVQLGGPSSGGGTYGYRTKSGQAFLIVTEDRWGQVGSIHLRDFAKWRTWRQRDQKLTTEDLRGWKTPQGIGLGSLEEEVLRAYGKPSGVANLELEHSQREMGKRMLIYKGRFKEIFPAARFRIRDGKVSWIDLENDAFLGPDCLGPYCTYGELSLNSLLRKLGLPPQKNTASPLECFQSQDARASLHFRTDVESPSDLDDVLLSDFPNCLHMRKRIATNGLRAWKTPEGIGLGSSEEDVLKAYGTPSAEKELDAQNHGFAMKGLIAGYRAGDNQTRVGNKVLIYGPRELQVVEFGIRDGKVSYIWLKDSDFWLKDGE